MKKDIEGRPDIEYLLENFYAEVRKDEVLGYIFNDVAKVNWEIHLPIICDFWEGVLFNKNNYKGNPLQVHLQLNELVKLQKEHFDRWLQLFSETVEKFFTGKNASLIIQRAVSIATVIQIKLANSQI